MAGDPSASSHVTAHVVGFISGGAGGGGGGNRVLAVDSPADSPADGAVAPTPNNGDGVVGGTRISSRGPAGSSTTDAGVGGKFGSVTAGYLTTADAFR